MYACESARARYDTIIFENNKLDFKKYEKGREQQQQERERATNENNWMKNKEHIIIIIIKIKSKCNYL